MCCQLRGYKYQSPDAFGINSNNIDFCYVDGISITYSSSSHKHIWRCVCGLISDNMLFQRDIYIVVHVIVIIL